MDAEHLYNVGTGTLGVTLIEAVNQIPPENFLDIGKVILQIIVAIGTLITLFRNKKSQP